MSSQITKLLFSIHLLWLLPFWPKLSPTAKNWKPHKKYRVDTQIICVNYFYEIQFVISIQLQGALCCTNSCCKRYRTEYSKRSMASEVVGQFMPYTSKARYQNAYELRTSISCKFYFLLSGSANWNISPPRRERNFEKHYLEKECCSNFYYANN